LLRSKLKIGHTPDADDAFMFSGLATGAVQTPGFDLEFILEDVQSLNLRAEKGDLDVVAVSAAAYPMIAERYWILSTGASVGRNYGPVLVAHPDPFPEGRGDEKEKRLDLQGRRVAIPGKHTTAAMLLNLYARNFQPVAVSFDRIIPMVKEGRADLGLVIHEGQITFQNHGLTKILDLGQSWAHEFNLPIPLGLEVVKKDLGETAARRFDRALKESILWAQSHREEALKEALPYARGVEHSILDQFVRMYVNEDTLHLGLEGKTALKTLFKKAKDLLFLPAVPRIDVIEG
jgi:1,4-dihydroxy-6-naphthoate synthase